MGLTYVVSGQRPFRWGMWHEHHDPGDGGGPRPGHVIYDALPGETVHEGWLQGLEGRIGALIRQGVLAAGSKVKDAPDVPPDTMIRSFTPGTAQNAPEGHPLRAQTDVPADVAAPAPAAPPAPVPAAEPAPVEAAPAPADPPAPAAEA